MRTQASEQATMWKSVGVLNGSRRGSLAWFTTLLLIGPVVCHGDVVLSIDADPSVAGIQDDITVLLGTIFTVDLVLELTTDSDSISSYGVSARFDTTELDVVSAIELAPPPLSNLNAGVGGIAEDIGGNLGEVQTFEALTFGNGPTGPDVLNIGSITFTAVAPTTDGSVDILPGAFNSGVDGFFDNSGQGIAPRFMGATVTAIPEPSALAYFFLACSLTVLGRSLCRRRVKPTTK